MTRSARLVGINHVALEVDDLEEALSFYGKLFEMSGSTARRGWAWETSRRAPRRFASWATRAFSSPWGPRGETDARRSACRRPRNRPWPC
jgi:hypothetical protein